MINVNKVDVFRPIEATHVGPMPVVIRAIGVDNTDSLVGGVPLSTRRAHDYILLSALPKELAERVRTAVQAIIAGM